MRSERSLRIIENSKGRKKESNSPTLASSFSERKLFTRSFKNQPFPKELRRIVIGHKLKFSDFSDEEENSDSVVYQQEEGQVLQKKKVLPQFKLINDRGQFSAFRSRIKSQCKFGISSRRPKSVQSLKLPQVMQQKKEQDQLQKLQRSKLSQFKDRNEFNRCRNSDNNSNTQNSRQSLQPNHYPSPMPQKIPQNIQIQAQQNKSQKIRGDRSLYLSHISRVQQISKLIVDQVDDKRRKQQTPQFSFQQIIQQQKAQEQIDNINRLRISLQKLQHQNSYLRQAEVIKSRHNSENNSDQQIQPPCTHISTQPISQIQQRQ